MHLEKNTQGICFFLGVCVFLLRFFFASLIHSKNNNKKHNWKKKMSGSNNDDRYDTEEVSDSDSGEQDFNSFDVKPDSKEAFRDFNFSPIHLDKPPTKPIVCYFSTPSENQDIQQCDALWLNERISANTQLQALQTHDVNELNEPQLNEYTVNEMRSSDEPHQNEHIMGEMQKEAQQSENNLHDRQKEAQQSENNLHDGQKEAQQSENNLHDGQKEAQQSEKNLHDMQQEPQQSENNLHDGQKEAQQSEKNLHDMQQEPQQNENNFNDGQELNVCCMESEDFKHSIAKDTPRYCKDHLDYFYNLLIDTQDRTIVTQNDSLLRLGNDIAAKATHVFANAGVNSTIVDDMVDTIDQFHSAITTLERLQAIPKHKRYQQKNRFRNFLEYVLFFVCGFLMTRFLQNNL